MKISTLALIASAMVATTVAVAQAAQAEPTELDQLCAAQSWPRPVPDVVGLRYDPIMEEIPAGMSRGALACWDDIRGITADGRNARMAATVGWDTITAISPPPGTLVDRDEPITVHLKTMDWEAPTAFRPCDWVTTAEVADIFGFAGPVQTDGYVPPGSVAQDCSYRDPGRTVVLTRLYTTGAFAVDAAADYSLYTDENATPISGLGLAAKCITGLRGAQGSSYNELPVLLGNYRLFVAQGLGAQPCDQLTQLARTAIGRL
jgi:hypothetical protein